MLLIGVYLPFTADKYRQKRISTMLATFKQAATTRSFLCAANRFTLNDDVKVEVV